MPHSPQARFRRKELKWYSGSGRVLSRCVGDQLFSYASPNRGKHQAWVWCATGKQNACRVRVGSCPSPGPDLYTRALSLCMRHAHNEIGRASEQLPKKKQLVTLNQLMGQRQFSTSFENLLLCLHRFFFIRLMFFSGEQFVTSECVSGVFSSFCFE